MNCPGFSDFRGWIRVVQFYAESRDHSAHPELDEGLVQETPPQSELTPNQPFVRLRVSEVV
jgi:hypothetical protein